MTSPTQENCSLSAAQRASLANAHMDAEVELALEDPEYRQSLHEDAAAADADMVPYYDPLFAKVSKREQERERRSVAPTTAPHHAAHPMAAAGSTR